MKLSRTNLLSRIVVLILGTAIAAIAALGTSATANAATTYGASGAPGTFTMPYVYGQYVPYANSRISTAATTVTESPSYASRDQYVCATYRLYRLVNGSSGQYWTHDKSARTCTWITAAYNRATIYGSAFTNQIPLKGYSMDVRLTWQLSNGAVIGARTYDWNRATDYRCATSKCVASTSTVGGFMQFGY